jgi:hypothetical protein
MRVGPFPGCRSWAGHYCKHHTVLLSHLTIGCGIPVWLRLGMALYVRFSRIRTVTRATAIRRSSLPRSMTLTSATPALRPILRGVPMARIGPSRPGARNEMARCSVATMPTENPIAEAPATSARVDTTPPSREPAGPRRSSRISISTATDFEESSRARQCKPRDF